MRWSRSFEVFAATGLEPPHFLGWTYDEQELIEFYGRAIIRGNRLDHPLSWRLDRRVELHHLDQAQWIALIDPLPDFDERLVLREGRR